MTSFDEVIDLALVIVNDFSLTNLYQRDEETFKKFCDGLLVSAIPNFTGCENSLSYDLGNREFLNTLSNEEIAILADFWAIQWLTRIANTKAYLDLKTQTTSFKNHSEAQWTKDLTNKLDGMREKVKQKITDYQLQNLSNIVF